jgi:protein-S-isoprenylcysteine O-methyltransferase Ste14
MYTAALLWVVGFPLVIRSGWGALAGILVIGPAIWLRIREEEAMLLEAFGDEYRQYQARTWRLVPFIF